jgi:GNAT superfamily N-acetyltransferase
MENVTVRLAGSADIDAVLRLQEQWVAEDITYGFEPDPRKFAEARLGPLFLVGEAEGALVAFAYGSIHVSEGLSVTPASECYLEVDTIYVTPEFRSGGIGGGLLDGLIGAAQAEGVSRVHVFSATKDHDRVLEFYRKHGFRPWGVQLFK